MASYAAHIGARVGLVLIALGLTACAGSKVLRTPLALDLPAPLAVEADAAIAVSLDWVVIRGGPGSWARNADWDEYRVRVRNLTQGSVDVNRITLLDSSATVVETNNDRRQLIRASTGVARRYAESGIKVKAGMSGTGLVAAGGASYVAGVSLGAAVLTGSATGAAAGFLAVGAIFAAPVVMVGGAFRGLNNAKVAAEIVTRHTTLPAALPAAGELALVAFFPISPAPRRIDVDYTDASGIHRLSIDTSEVLKGLHLAADTVMPAQ